MFLEELLVLRSDTGCESYASKKIAINAEAKISLLVFGMHSIAPKTASANAANGVRNRQMIGRHII